MIEEPTRLSQLVVVPNVTAEQIRDAESDQSAADAVRAHHEVQAMRGRELLAAYIADEAKLDEGDEFLLFPAKSGRQRTQTHALDAVDALLDGDLVSDTGRGNAALLVLCGGVGVGKSLAAARGWLRVAWPFGRGYGRREDGGWISVRELRGLYFAAIGDERKRYLALRDDAPYLVVDEVGTEREKEIPDVVAALSDLARCRLRGGRKTVFITNSLKGDFLKRYEDRFEDRLLSRGRVLGCGEGSMRRVR